MPMEDVFAIERAISSVRKPRQGPDLPPPSGPSSPTPETRLSSMFWRKVDSKPSAALRAFASRLPGFAFAAAA